MAKKSILLGSGEPSVATSITAILGGDYELSSHARLREFLRAASARRYDAVVFFPNTMDAAFSGKPVTIQKTMAAIRIIRLTRPHRLVALSTLPEWKNDLLSAGCDTFLCTPVNATKLKAAVG